MWQGSRSFLLQVLVIWDWGSYTCIPHVYDTVYVCTVVNLKATGVGKEPRKAA